jgi:hypothetical protein
MTPERIAEMRKYLAEPEKWIDCPSAWLEECLDEIERLQRQVSELLPLVGMADGIGELGA